MKIYFLILLGMIGLNIVMTGLFQDLIKKDGNKKLAIEAEHSAQRTRNAFLLRERQDLLRRDRIIGYATNNLGMQLLRPDEIASGRFVKEIQEESSRNNIVYTFIDLLIPSMNAIEARR